MSSFGTVCHPCHRKLDATTGNPFISATETLTLKISPSADGGWSGVNFTTNPNDVSPHILQTHCECAMHIYPPAIAQPLSEVLSKGAEDLLGELPAMHIKVQPVSALSVKTIVSVTADDSDVFDICFGSDHYFVRSREPGDVLTEAMFATDRVVTKGIIESALLEARKSMSDLDMTTRALFGTMFAAPVLLVDMVGEGNQMNNWAYLTNTAVEYLVEECGVRVLVVNTASVDRENDGGFVPNHKAVFRNRSNLVIELADLSSVADNEVAGKAVLNVEPHNIYQDCGASKLEFTPVR